MKTVLVIVEGAADVAREELEGRTPLQVARCPSASRLATEGRCGLLAVPQDKKHRRHEVVLASLCGVPMDEALQLGRGPLELEGVGTAADGFQFVYSGTYITMDEGVVRDRGLARMTVKETAALTDAIQSLFDPAQVRIVTVGGSHVLVLVKSEESALATGTPPALIEDDGRASMPSGKKGEVAKAIMDKASHALSDMTINDVRLDLGENPATHLWLWGGGTPFKPSTFFGGTPRKACMVTQSWMARGFARVSGMDVMSLEDPWAEECGPSAFDTVDLERRLGDLDFLVVYVGAAPETAAAEKVRLLERMDLHVLAPLLKVLDSAGPCRVMLTGDGVWPALATRVPTVLHGEGVAADGVEHWDESACAEGELGNVKLAKAFGVMTG